MWTVKHFTAEKLTHLITKSCPDTLGDLTCSVDCALRYLSKIRKVLGSETRLVPEVFHILSWNWSLLCLCILSQISKYIPLDTFSTNPDTLEFPSNWGMDATSPRLNHTLNSALSLVHEVRSHWLESQERKSQCPDSTAYFGKINVIV